VRFHAKGLPTLEPCGESTSAIFKAVDAEAPLQQQVNLSHEWGVFTSTISADFGTSSGSISFHFAQEVIVNSLLDFSMNVQALPEASLTAALNTCSGSQYEDAIVTKAHVGCALTMFAARGDVEVPKVEVKALVDRGFRLGTGKFYTENPDGMKRSDAMCTTNAVVRVQAMPRTRLCQILREEQVRRLAQDVSARRNVVIVQIIAQPAINAVVILPSEPLYDGLSAGHIAPDVGRELLAPMVPSHPHLSEILTKSASRGVQFELRKGVDQARFDEIRTSAGLQDCEVDVCVKSSFHLDEPIAFSAGGARIEDKSLPLLLELAKVINNHEGLQLIEIQSHTNNQGIEAELLRLSEARASAVRDFLVLEGKVARQRLSARGYGGSRPIADSDTPEGLRQNERIEIISLRETPAD